MKPAPQPQQKNKPQQSTSPATKPTQGSNPKPGPKPGPKPSTTEAVSVVYYTDGFELNIGQVQQAAQELQPLIEQAMQNMPSAGQIQEMARQLQGPVTQQVEEAVQQLPQPMQEMLNEPIIITPQSVNSGSSNGSKSKRCSKSKWTYGVPGMTGGNGNGPLIYNP